MTRPLRLPRFLLRLRTRQSEPIDPTDDEDQWDPQSYHESFPWWILVVVIAALCVAGTIGYFVGRRVVRTRRLRKWLALPPREGAERIYLFLLGRLSRVGFKMSQGATLSEFSESSARQMDMIAHETGVPFSEITDTCQRCSYGRSDPPDDDLVPLAAFYQGFWKGARTHLGNWKYFLKSFRL